MSKNAGKSPKAAGLRRRAEQQLKAREPEGSLPEMEARRLLHELQVHQIELEMQNEELMQARAQAEAAFAHYADLYDFAPVGYLTLGFKGDIRQANFVAAALLGTERGNLAGKRFSSFVDSRDRPAFNSFLKQVFASQAKEVCELKLQDKGGEPCVVHMECVAEDSGEACRITMMEITERKRLEKELLDMRKEMDSLQKSQVAAQTAAAFAHEVNQPLQSISSYSRVSLMLLDAAKPDLGQIRLAIEGSERQSLRAGRSIHKLLDLFSLGEVPTEAFDLNQEIRNIVAIAKAEHDLKFSTELNLEDGLPRVQANRTHVQKVLLNLFHNGIEAMQEAGLPLPAITITVCTRKGEGEALVMIRDNGPGFKRENLDRLFEPFFTTKKGGIGMGLIISRSLIEANGGQLWVDPQGGPGGTFRLTLPFAP